MIVTRLILSNPCCIDFAFPRLTFHFEIISARMMSDSLPYPMFCVMHYNSENQSSQINHKINKM